MITFLKNILFGSISIYYANSLNALVLLMILNVVFFYLIRNLMVNKIKKKWKVLTFNITLLGILKKLILAWTIFYAFEAILVWCPVGDTTPDPIPLHALYEYVMNQNTNLMRYGVSTMGLMLPVGLWLAENLKAVRSGFLYKWTAIICGLVGIYLEYSQYELGIGKASVDDVAFFVLGAVGGTLLRDAYDKVKQMIKVLIQVIKNEQRKKEKQKLQDETGEDGTGEDDTGGDGTGEDGTAEDDTESDGEDSGGSESENTGPVKALVKALKRRFLKWYEATPVHAFFQAPIENVLILPVALLGILGKMFEYVGKKITDGVETLDTHLKEKLQMRREEAQAKKTEALLAEVEEEDPLDEEEREAIFAEIEDILDKDKD